jgi:peptidoglycan/xylan/chitin deacetylase (PgdA/CDA1 family)
MQFRLEFKALTLTDVTLYGNANGFFGGPGILTMLRTVIADSSGYIGDVNNVAALVRTTYCKFLNNKRPIRVVSGSYVDNNSLFTDSQKEHVFISSNNLQTATLNNSMLGAHNTQAGGGGYALNNTSTNGAGIANNASVLYNGLARGYLTSNWTLNNYITYAPQIAQPRRKGIISFLVDDASSANNWSELVNLMDDFGFKATWAVDTNGMSGSDWSLAVDSVARGYDIASHSRNHPDLTSLGAEDLSMELVASKSDIETNIPGFTVKTLVYPGYNHDATVRAAASVAGYISARGGTTDGETWRMTAMNKYDTYGILIGNAFGTKSENPTEAEIRGRVAGMAEYLNSIGGWITILMHDNGAFNTDMSIANMRIVMDELSKSNVNVMSYSDAMQYIIDNAETTTGTGGELVYERSEEDLGDNSSYQLKPTSPAIDSGTNVSLTTDYAGNPIYGLPDIGAYEYQPPHTIGTNKIDITAGARVYGDGKFRDLAATSGTTADLAITPASGSFDSYSSTQARPAWLDILPPTGESTLIWEESHKKWKESSDTLGTTSTLHTIGDLTPDTYYNIKIDDSLAIGNINGADCTDGVCKSNGLGEITFTYTGGYSSHTFDVSLGDNNAPTVTNDTNPKFHTDTTQVTLSLTTSENSTCHYSDDQSEVYADMITFTTTGTTAHSTAATGLTPGDHTYYAICRDTVGNDTDYTLTFEIAQRENDTGTSDAKLKTDENNETLDEDKKIYFDEDEGRLKGQDETIANGTVKIYKEGKKYTTVDVDSDGNWSKKLKFGHDKTYTLKLKFYDQYGTLRDEKEYDVKVDTEKPKFTNPFSKTLTIQKDDKINFEATDDTGVDYYKIQILDNQGHVVRAWKKQIKSFYFIPESILDQADIIMVRAYDKAGNYVEEKTILNIAENQLNIANVNKNTPANNLDNQTSGPEASNNQNVQGVSDEKNNNARDASNRPGQAQSEARETFKWWNPFSWF